MKTEGKSPGGDRLGGEAIEAWLGLLRLHAGLVSTLERELEDELGLPLSWYDVLAQLRAAGGRMRMQDLASAVLLSRSGVTRLVDRMETAGLVVRESCPSDRRGTYTAVTPHGQELFRKAHPIHLKGIKAHFASALTEAELQALSDIASKVLPGLPAS